jgi:hypothetical protein
LLRNPTFALRALELLAVVTVDFVRSPPVDRRAAAVRTLRQALGYGWSVAVAALPGEGLAMFARLEASDDPDVAWIVRENRKKNRLKRLLEQRPGRRSKESDTSLRARSSIGLTAHQASVVTPRRGTQNVTSIAVRPGSER